MRALLGRCRQRYALDLTHMIVRFGLAQVRTTDDLFIQIKRRFGLPLGTRPDEGLQNPLVQKLRRGGVQRHPHLIGIGGIGLGVLTNTIELPLECGLYPRTRALGRFKPEHRQGV